MFLLWILRHSGFTSLMRWYWHGRFHIHDLYFKAFTPRTLLCKSNLPLNNVEYLELPPSLKHWIVCAAELTTFPNITSSHFPNMSVVNIMENQTRVIPRDAWQLLSSNLNTLEVQYNTISTMLKLSRKPNLREIDISNNIYQLFLIWWILLTLVADYIECFGNEREHIFLVRWRNVCAATGIGRFQIASCKFFKKIMDVGEVSFPFYLCTWINEQIHVYESNESDHNSKSSSPSSSLSLSPSLVS